VVGIIHNTHVVALTFILLSVKFIFNSIFALMRGIALINGFL